MSAEALDAAELEVGLAAVCQRSEVTALSLAIESGGRRATLAFKDGGQRVAPAKKPLFAVACLQDVVTAVIALELVRRGELDLPTPAEAILPELTAKRRRRGGEDAPVTVRALLTRTSGFQDPRTLKETRSGGPDFAELAGRLRSGRRLFSPGAVFNYSGIDRLLLAEALQRTTGKSMARLGYEIILQPTGVKQRPEQLGEPGADGVSPVAKFDADNFATIVAHLASEAPAREGEPFAAEVRTALTKDCATLSRSIRLPPWRHSAVAFTHGIFRYSNGLFGFNGWAGGQGASVRYDPVKGAVIVLGLEGKPGVRDAILTRVAEALGYHSVHARELPCTIGGLNGLEPRDVAGTYEGWAQGYQSRVTIEGGVLTCEQAHNGEVFRRLRARVEDDAWLVVDNALEIASLEFFRDPGTGRVCLASGYLPYAMEAGGAKEGRA